MSLCIKIHSDSDGGRYVMALKIVRNDITKMNTEAVVNTASSFVEVGP